MMTKEQRIKWKQVVEKYYVENENCSIEEIDKDNAIILWPPTPKPLKVLISTQYAAFFVFPDTLQDYDIIFLFCEWESNFYNKQSELKKSIDFLKPRIIQKNLQIRCLFLYFPEDNMENYTFDENSLERRKNPFA